MLNSIVKIILKLAFRVQVRGLSHFHQAGDRVLVIANHPSLLPLYEAVVAPSSSLVGQTLCAYVEFLCHRHTQSLVFEKTGRFLATGQQGPAVPGRSFIQ